MIFQMLSDYIQLLKFEKNCTIMKQIAYVLLFLFPKHGWTESKKSLGDFAQFLRKLPPEKFRFVATEGRDKSE